MGYTCALVHLNTMVMPDNNTDNMKDMDQYENRLVLLYLESILLTLQVPRVVACRAAS